MPATPPDDVDDIEHWYGAAKRASLPAKPRARPASFRDPDGPFDLETAPPESSGTTPTEADAGDAPERGDARSGPDVPFVGR